MIRAESAQVLFVTVQSLGTVVYVYVDVHVALHEGGVVYPVSGFDGPTLALASGRGSIAQGLEQQQSEPLPDHSAGLQSEYVYTNTYI